MLYRAIIRANYFYTTKLIYCFDKAKYYLLFLANIAKLCTQPLQHRLQYSFAPPFTIAPQRA